MALMIAFALAGWFLLRQPAIRSTLVGLVPHRMPLEMAVVRQLLAPRSVAIAGLMLLALTCIGLVIPPLRESLLQPVPRKRFFLSLVVFAQLLVALAVMLNLHFYFYRQYGQPVWSIDREEVLAYTLPQAWQDSNSLKKLLPAESRVAFRTSGEDIFLLPAMSYPIAFYEFYPDDDQRWRSDAGFAGLADDRGITHLLRYSPFNRANPFTFRRVK
jgi:hypothetical protein